MQMCEGLKSYLQGSGDPFEMFNTFFGGGMGNGGGGQQKMKFNMGGGGSGMGGGGIEELLMGGMQSSLAWKCSITNNSYHDIAMGLAIVRV